MTAGKVKIVLLIAFLLAAGAVGWWYEFQRVHAGNGALRVSGNIETTEVDISFKIAGRVVNRLVDEGEKVSSGQLIAELDTADLKADVALRQAELQAAQAALAELEAGSRPEEIAASRAAAEKAAAVLAELKAGSRPQEIEAAKAQLIAAEVDENHMEADWRRAEALLPTNAVAKKDYDQAKAAYDVAVKKHRQVLMQYELVKEGPRKEQIDQAQAALAQAQEQYKLVKEGPRKEDIDQARAKVNQTEASLGLAEVRLGYAKIYSPLAGVVLSKNIEPGEYVAPGTPVVTVADLEHVWLRAYVDAMDLDRVKPHQAAEISIDSRAGKVYQGTISFIAQEAEFTPKIVQTEKERVKLVYRIKIDILNPQWELKPGMPADACIITSEPLQTAR